MRNIIQTDHEQIYLLPPSIDEWLPEDHLANFITEVISELDISCITKTYGNRGGSFYSAHVLLSLIIYGYCTGTYSSRKIEKATYESIPFRVISGNTHPDHDTIASFRKTHLGAIKELFAQVLMIAREMGFLKLGKLSVDGSKFKANASKHKAMSYKRANDLKKQLEAEIDALLKMAEEVDEREVETDIDIPSEIVRRKDRVKKMNKAIQVIEERAKEEYENEKLEYEAKMAERKAKEEKTGKKSKGKAPKEPEFKVKDKAQYNFTDPDSRIMKAGNGKHFDQDYNAQAAVEHENMLIVGNSLSNHPNDKKELVPTLDDIPKDIYKPNGVAADCGYFSENNIKASEEREVEPYIATGRIPHNQSFKDRFTGLPEAPDENASPKEKMAYKLKTDIGKAVYRLRKMTVEPVFGIIKNVMGFRQFSLRGEENVAGEWDLVCLAYNLRRLHVLKTSSTG